VLPIDTCFRILWSSLAGLAAFHALGICFGDIKPDNMINTPIGCVLIDAGACASFGHALRAVTSPWYLDCDLVASARFDFVCLATTVFTLARGRVAWPVAMTVEKLRFSLNAWRRSSADPSEQELAEVLVELLNNPEDAKLLAESKDAGIASNAVTLLSWMRSRCENRQHRSRDNSLDLCLEYTRCLMTSLLNQDALVTHISEINKIIMEYSF
jgi:serine/threonine protein kinase